ncbi:MAG: XRE family transcriptional regulator [Paludibacteraceae bacterium]|nr:XRE family transcriptional regulator [Paludibacteraceae bacterium]
MVDIGSLIKQEMQRQGRGVTWLAKQIGRDRTLIYRIFNNKSIDTDNLLRISVALNHNFFDFYVEEYRKLAR